MRNTTRYAKFLRDLMRRGSIRFKRNCRERVGVFSVKKPKNSTLRLILGCRNSSLHFERPPDVSLLAAEGLGNIEIGEGLEELEAAALSWKGCRGPGLLP